MKRTLIYLTVGFIALGLLGAGALKFVDKLENSAAEHSEQAGDGSTIAESTGKIEGLEFAQTVPEDAAEPALLAMMHKMTHQKVVASEKWGLIRMNEESINKAKTILQNSDFDSKEDLLEMIGRWENGRFDRVDDDHNFIWDLQGGSVGRATGVLNEQQEQEFIENNFTGE